jgi:hypothetical protein
MTLVIQEQTLSFSITSIKGSWSDDTADGRLEYHILHSGSNEGMMVITRQSGTTSIHIDFTESNADGIDYDFIINRFEAN